MIVKRIGHKLKYLIHTKEMLGRVIVTFSSAAAMDMYKNMSCVVLTPSILSFKGLIIDVLTAFATIMLTLKRIFLMYLV